MGGRRFEISGTVQGVGFRPWAYRVARETGIGGRVHNNARGVVIEAFGHDDAIARFVDRLQRDLPAPAQIRSFATCAIQDEGVSEFTIVGSGGTGQRTASIPPDLATCPACQAEVSDPANRRFGYAFTNCTHCGPRYTISTGIPYDRPATTMASFPLCPECKREYLDPEDRRFHAQPNACPTCGPKLTLASGCGRAISTADPIGDVAALLDHGAIVAVKGLGGFHLACDAASSRSVVLLRRRKNRDQKPFAVMVAGMEEARLLGVLTSADEQLLSSPERPIVLVPRRRGARVCREVAPDTSLIGLFLPYTPLHHLLLQCMGRALVMTSANVADEPIAHGNDEALRRLTGIADAFLLHDRDIAARCDDSVARVIAGAPVILRRSRGYVPRPIRLRRPVSRPVLACGGQMKNAFCLVAEDLAYFGPHIGDLDTAEAVTFFEQEVERMERYLGIEPEVIACDMHPGYSSSAYARTRAGRDVVAVQHHHAHVASARAEHNLRGPVLGVAYDGTGYGEDGTLWGGEIMLVHDLGYQRFASLRPIPLAGGDRAIRHVWRIALALVEDAFSGAPPFNAFEYLRAVDPSTMSGVRSMLERNISCIPARGVGRYFDGIGSLVLERRTSHYEGQVAMALDAAARDVIGAPYGFALDQSQEPVEIDLRPMVREVVADLMDAVPPATIAARFHATLVAATMAAIELATDAYGRLPVLLSGGCFHNKRLTEGVLEAAASCFNVFTHSVVPPGDGGLALGQAVVADERTRGRAS